MRWGHPPLLYESVAFVGLDEFADHADLIEPHGVGDGDLRGSFMVVPRHARALVCLTIADPLPLDLGKIRRHRHDLRRLEGGKSTGMTRHSGVPARIMKVGSIMRIVRNQGDGHTAVSIRAAIACHTVSIWFGTGMMSKSADVRQRYPTLSVNVSMPKCR